MTAQVEWSLARAIARHILLAATVPVLIAVVVGHWFLSGSVSRELTALAEEEINEARLRLPSGWDPARDFPAIAQQCQDEHPTFPMAWRVFDSDSGRILGEFGVLRLLDAHALSSSPTVAMVDVAAGKATMTAEVTLGRNLGLVIDGDSLSHVIPTYWLLALATLGSCVGLAWISSRRSANRVRRLLAQVAADVDPRPSPRTDSAPTRQLPVEIKQVAAELTRLLAEGHQVAEDSRVLTMGLAHELRSPVQNLVGKAEVALMRVRDAGFYQQTLTSQLEELGEFSDALDNLLMFCARKHETSATDEAFDLALEAQVRFRREKERANRSGVSVRLACHGDTSMRGDREAVLRALRNVVANAVDWTPAGGEVSVEIRGDNLGIRVTVDDDGPGLPAELSEKIFEPFFQGPAAARRRTGYGLGLAMTKRVVDAYAGEIRVETRPEGGGRFMIRLDRQLVCQESQ